MTVLDEGRTTEVDGSVAGGRLLLGEGALAAALGFVRKPEGLCKDDICLPVPDGSPLLAGDSIDVSELAARTGRPIAIDEAVGVAYVGPAAADRAARLRSGQAPDFTLPDLGGRAHSLSDHLGKKVVLAVYGSW